MLRNRVLEAAFEVSLMSKSCSHEFLRDTAGGNNHYREKARKDINLRELEQQVNEKAKEQVDEHCDYPSEIRLLLISSRLTKCWLRSARMRGAA